MTVPLIRLRADLPSDHARLMESEMPKSVYGLQLKANGYTEEDVLHNINKLMTDSAISGELILHDSIDGVIAMERRRGMPAEYDRHNGLVFFKITVERVGGDDAS